MLGQTEASIPQLTIQLQQGENALRVSLGMPPEPLGPLLGRGTAKIPVAPAKIFVGIPSDLLRRRPDVRVAELKAAAKSAQIGVAASDLYPAISLAGKVGGSASTINGGKLVNMFSSAGLAYSFGPTFQWNILNYGQITNNVRLQDATLQQYLVDYQNTVLKAQQDVENGISTYLQSKIAVNALRYSVAAANGAVRISILQSQQGTRDFTSVLTSEQNLLTAENDLATLPEGNVPLGVTMVYEALGGGWQIREGNDFVPAATNAEMRARTDWGNVLPAPLVARYRCRRCPDRRLGFPGPRTQVRRFARRNFSIFFPKRAFRHEAKVDGTSARKPWKRNSGSRRRGARGLGSAALPRCFWRAADGARLLMRRRRQAGTVRQPAAQRPRSDTPRRAPGGSRRAAEGPKFYPSDAETTGTAASTNIVKLIARVEGYLEKIHFADGALVKKDDLLFTIQQAQYKAQLQQAKAQLLQQQAALVYAKTELVRYTELFHKHAATATEVDHWVYQKAAAEAGILNAQGQIEVAQLNLDYTEVKAPFDGLMGKHLLDPGNTVGGGGQPTALAEIHPARSDLCERDFQPANRP